MLFTPGSEVKRVGNGKKRAPRAKKGRLFRVEESEGAGGFLKCCQKQVLFLIFIYSFLLIHFFFIFIFLFVFQN